MKTGVQFTGTLAPNQTHQWFSHSWPADWHVVWHMMPTAPQTGGSQIEWDVAVERTAPDKCTYWITVKNLTANTVSFEGRYVVFNDA